MAFLSAILFAAEIKQPSGLWELLLLQVFSFIQNYGWRVVLFTLCLKLLLSPLDIFQRYKARKNQKITERLKPQMEKLQKQYTDQTVLAQKQMQLNKKEGFSYMSSCLPAIITLVIMFTLLASLNNVSQYMNFKDYYEMYSVYNEAVAEYETLGESDIAKLKEDGYLVDGYTDASGNEQNDQTQYAQKKVFDFYHENKTGWLWVNNIWSPDVPWKKEVNDYKTFQGNIGKYGTDVNKSGFTADELELMKARYSTVMGMLLIEENNGGNGYLILPILSVLLSVGTQLVSMRMQKKSGQMSDNMAGGGAMKIMMWIMPVMIGWFSLSYTSAFSLYLIVSYAFSLLINVGSNVILLAIDKREQKKQDNTVVKYGRPDPNDMDK